MEKTKGKEKSTPTAREYKSFVQKNQIENLKKNQYILLKCTYLPKQSTDSIQSLSNFQWHFLRKNKTKTKIHMELQRTLNSQDILEEEKQSRRHHAS